MLKAAGLTVLRSYRHEPKPVEMRKTEAMAEATSKKQEASLDLVSNRTGSSHAALPFGGATVNFVKCSISKKSIGGSPTLHRRKPRCS